VVEHLNSQLIPKGLRDTVAMLTVSIENAQNQRVGSWIISHDQGILVLLSGVVRSVTLLRDTGIFGNSATNGSFVLQYQ
jgi:hypothetical protein